MAEKTKEIKETKDPMEELVDVYIPKDRNDPSDVTVWVNERSWTIQRGVHVKIPRCAAEQLEHSERMKDQALAFMELAQNAASQHAREL